MTAPARAAARRVGVARHTVAVRRLAVVDTASRRRVPGLIGASAVLVVLVMLATAAVHIALISGQRKLDRLDVEISAARRVQESLRRSETELKSPAEVQRIATEQLGMVPAAPPQLVSPRPVLIGVLPIAAPPGGEGK